MKFLFMDYLYNLPNATDGIDTILAQTIETMPSFIPLTLAFVFFTIFIGGSLRQIIRTGSADYPFWASLSSIAILIVTLLFSISEGYVNLNWLIIVVFITIFSAVWLFLSKRQGEI